MKFKHECDNLLKFLEKTDCDISFSRKGNFYYLNKKILADKKVVSDGEAEYIGQTIIDFEIRINYCPFCGEQFSKELIEFEINTGENNNHQCRSIRKPVKHTYDSITFCSNSRNFYICYERNANEKDVLEGEADEAGEFLFASNLVTSFCPFCGEQFSKEIVVACRSPQ